MGPRSNGFRFAARPPDTSLEVFFRAGTWARRARLQRSIPAIARVAATSSEVCSTARALRRHATNTPAKWLPHSFPRLYSMYGDVDYTAGACPEKIRFCHRQSMTNRLGAPQCVTPAERTLDRFDGHDD